MKVKNPTSRQIIDHIAENNRTIYNAEKLSEKLSDFAFDTVNEHLQKAIEELNEIADINRRENNRLLKDFNELVKNDNKKLAIKK